jgi:hypothetical protein
MPDVWLYRASVIHPGVKKDARGLRHDFFNALLYNFGELRGKI